METLSENRENTLDTPTKKISKTISERLKRSAGKVFDDVKDTLNRPSRRNSDAELMKDTPEKSITTQATPSTVDGEDIMKVFGADLDQVLIQERITGVQSAYGIPSIVQECLNYLIPNYAQEEGLFRISGNNVAIQALKQNVDLAAAQASAYRIVDELNCHNISGLLKLYIRELPAPLYPKALHADLIAAGRIEDLTMRVTALNAIAKQLPDSSFALLKKLTCTLNDLLENVAYTKMTAANLSTVWSPNLIWDRDTEVDPTMCLQFSRDTNLAIQFTIEAAYEMFKKDGGDEASAEPPKRRSLFDIQPDLVHGSDSNATLHDNNASSTYAEALDSSIQEDLSPRSAQLYGMTQITSHTPGFEDMLALASTPSRKRPRSIWVGNGSSTNDELDAISASNSSSSLTGTADRTPFAPLSSVSNSLSQSALASIKSRGSSKRRSRAANIETDDSEMTTKRRKVVSGLPDVSEDAVHQLDVLAPALPAMDSIAAPSPRKSLRSSIRKSLRLARGSRASIHSSVTGTTPLVEVQLYYYCDNDNSSVALRKLLVSMHIIPREIRNAQNDAMSVEEAIFFAKTCEDIVVVRRSDKPYTMSHKITDLSEADLRIALCNEAGEPRSPAIIAGSTYIVGYDKQLKDIFRYYMHRTKKSPTPIRV